MALAAAPAGDAKKKTSLAGKANEIQIEGTAGLKMKINPEAYAEFPNLKAKLLEKKNALNLEDLKEALAIESGSNRARYMRLDSNRLVFFGYGSNAALIELYDDTDSMAKIASHVMQKAASPAMGSTVFLPVEQRKRLMTFTIYEGDYETEINVPGNTIEKAGKFFELFAMVMKNGGWMSIDYEGQLNLYSQKGDRIAKVQTDWGGGNTYLEDAMKKALGNPTDVSAKKGQNSQS